MEDSLFTLVEHLPGEAAEALLKLATGGKPHIPTMTTPSADPFKHLEPRGRVWGMASVEELARALD